MASFTDKTPPQFNPYIQQLPVEAMVAVGTQKQKAYDEGVQKIQTQLDNIAGLDVANDVGRAYLQSKVNQLGNQLRTVAAGDFSNFQFTNSVGGMTKQVIRDKGVQNAVNSTAKLRKEQAFMEEERKKGDLNPANEYVFNKQAGAWLESNDVMQGFNAKYDKYFDVDKFMREEFNSLKPDGFTIDQVFETGPDGKPRIDPATGTYKIAASMARLKKEGLFPEKVQAALDHIFNDPRVSNQLQISGQYAYRGSTPDVLASKLLTVKESQVNMMDKNIMDLTMQKSMLTDGVEKAIIKKRIDDLITNKNSTVAGYNDLIANINDNADGVRGMLYKAEEKDKYKTMYTNVIESRTEETSPRWEANFKMNQEANNMARHRDTMKMQQAQMAQTKELAYAGMANQFRIATLKKKVEDEEAAMTDMTTAAMETPDDYVNAFKDKAESTWKTYTAATDDLLFSSGVVTSKELNEYMGKHKGMSRDDAMRAVINTSARAYGMTPEAFRTEMLDKANKHLQKNPSKLNPEMKYRKDSVENATKHWDGYLNEKKKIDAMAPIKGLEIIQDAEDFRHPGAPGGIVRKEDQYDLALVKRGQGIFSPFYSEDVKKAADAAEKRLMANGYTIRNINAVTQFTSKFPTGGGSGAKTPYNTTFNKLLEAADSDTFNTSMEDRAKAIKANTNFSPTIVKTVDTGHPETDKRRAARIASMAGEYARTGMNESPGFLDNSAAFGAIANDPKKGTFQLKATKDASGKVTHKVIAYNADSSFAGEMTISKEQAESVDFKPELKWETPEVSYARNRMYATGNNTTAYGDVRDTGTYLNNDVGFTKSNFDYLQKMPVDIKGNIKEGQVVGVDGNMHTVYYNFLYINNNGVPIVKDFPVSKPTMEEAVQFFKDLKPDTVTQIIKEKTR